MIDKINISINKTSEQKSNKQQNFKGAATNVLTGLRALNNSPAIGACAVDLCSMVIPRTVIETKNRGKQSGIETFFREGSSCIIHACVGLIGLGAAAILSGNFNKQNKIKAQNIFTNADTINNMSSIWQNSNGQPEKFFEGFLNNIKGLDGFDWKSVSQNISQDTANGLVNLANKTKALSEAASKQEKSILKNEVKELKEVVLTRITKDTGAQASFKLKGINGAKDISSNLSELIDNAVVMANTFSTKTKEELPGFIKSLCSNKTKSTLLGLGICAALCMSVQPLNRYLTKKRTGQDGFVGVKDRQADKSKKFKTIKTGLGIAFPVFAISTIGRLGDFVSNVQFNSKIPTINQFKFLYGLTIGSRFMSARDKDELREGVVKDTLGFTNWLILGGMVSKLTARALGGKELINNPVSNENGKKGLKYAAQWLTKASVKSYDEVLLPAAQNIIKDGKKLKFTELVKNADSATKAKIYKIAGSQIAGYLYSGLVLGVGISKLNIFITKKLNENKENKIHSTNSNKNDMVNMKHELSSIFQDFA